MNIFKNIILFSSLLLLLSGCDEGGIDDISKIDPGADLSAPIISLSYPTEGTKIRVPEPTASINIAFTVEDDIEIQNIVLYIDDLQIASFATFKDYRRYIGEYLYEEVTNGQHTLTVVATDIEGKSTTLSVNFEKVSPYTPIYAGEILYMPFNGDFTDLISFQTANAVGTPGFAGSSIISGEGENAYRGASGAYLTLPTADLGLENGGEFTAVFWTQVNNDPDRAALLVMGPEDPSMPATPNNRTSGFRFFREAAGEAQRFKLNIGNGTADSWFDGGENADVTPNTGEWEHMAFTITNSQATVYINGEIVRQGELPNGVSWEGCDVLSIMSGAPRFTQWGHLSDQGIMDELRLFNRSLPQSEIKEIIERESGEASTGTGYTPKYEGEVFYMPFENNTVEQISGTEATLFGTPSFSAGLSNSSAYQGAEGSYLTYPTNELLSDNFSACFWMNINADPDRAGILVMGPPDPDKPETPNNRNSGFRFFREAAGDAQRFKLNIGTGEGESWIDGGAAADVSTTGEWVHFGFAISDSEAIVYINGQEVARNEVNGGIDWTGCDILSIMSGDPRFIEWGHRSDHSKMDELRLFNKTLSGEEINQIMND